MSFTRDNVEAWVNPSVWDDPAEAERAIDAILASGSEDEADWTRIAGGDPEHVLDAAARDYARTAEAHDASTTALRAAVTAAVNAGMSEVEAARRAGATRMTIRAWLGKKPKK